MLWDVWWSVKDFLISTNFWFDDIFGTIDMHHLPIKYEQQKSKWSCQQKWHCRNGNDSLCDISGFVLIMFQIKTFLFLKELAVPILALFFILWKTKPDNGESSKLQINASNSSNASFF